MDRYPSAHETGLWLDWWSPPGADTSGRVVVTGVFDLLHVGHVRFLSLARARGRSLLVGIEDDERTRAWKGPTRPVVPQDERAEVVAALGVVDGVFVVHGPPASHEWQDYAALMAPLRPAQLAWTTGDPFGSVKRRAATLLGAGAVEIAEVAGHSTSRLVDRTRADGHPPRAVR